MHEADEDILFDLFDRGPAKHHVAAPFGLDFAAGLRAILRHDPDIVMIGEIRDKQTMGMALAYAQSGHLTLATLHANNSYHALGRILSFYAPEVRPALLADLAANDGKLRGGVGGVDVDSEIICRLVSLSIHLRTVSFFSHLSARRLGQQVREK